MELRRGVHAATKAALQDVFHPVVLVYLDWPLAPVRAHSGRGVITWGGFDWSGVGSFGSVEIPGEASGMAAVRATISLIAPPDDLFALHAAEIRNLPGQILFGVATERAGNVLIGDPFPVFTGYMDGKRFPIVLQDGARAQSVQIEMGVGPSARVSASPNHTREDQARAYPGDTAGRLVERAGDWARIFRW